MFCFQGIGEKNVQFIDQNNKQDNEEEKKSVEDQAHRQSVPVEHKIEQFELESSDQTKELVQTTEEGTGVKETALNIQSSIESLASNSEQPSTDMKKATANDSKPKVASTGTNGASVSSTKPAITSQTSSS